MWVPCYSGVNNLATYYEEVVEVVVAVSWTRLGPLT